LSPYSAGAAAGVTPIGAASAFSPCSTLSVIASVTVLSRAAGRPYPGALIGSLIAAVLVALLAAGWFRALRRSAAATPAPAV